MDLEQFYAADERRRHSEELEFGRDWSDEHGRCEVSWVEATSEVYLMSEPRAALLTGLFSDEYTSEVPVQQLAVEILGVVAGRAAIEAVMSGWQEAMPGENSIAWVRDRLANAASEANDPPAEPSDDLPES